MSVLVEGAMQANSPLKFFDMQVERMGADTHVVSAGVLPAPGEFIKVGDSALCARRG